MELVTAIALAARQGGFISRSQLENLGWTSGSINRAVQRALLTVHTEGIFQLVPMDGEEPLVRGAILALPDAVVSHGSAARLWGIPYVARLPASVSVHHRTTHRFPGVVVRRTLDLAPHHRSELRGLPITTPARTCVDVAADIHLKHLDTVIDGVLVGRITTYDELVAIGLETGRRGRPGTVNFRSTLAIRGDGTMAKATVLERLGHSLLRRFGLPEPVPQYPIPWDPTRRFDDAYPEVSIALEWDSRRWHSSMSQMAHDRARDREALLNGWALLRFTWHDIKQRPHVVAGQIREMIELRRTG